MGFGLGSVLMRSGLRSPDEASVDAITLFVVLLTSCIVIGHLLEKSRWLTESITALAIVSFSTLYTLMRTIITVSKCNVLYIRV